MTALAWRSAGSSSVYTAAAARDFDANPYPSTYRTYPGTPTALIGATVYDGKGGRIERGTVLLAASAFCAIQSSTLW